MTVPTGSEGAKMPFIYAPNSDLTAIRFFDRIVTLAPAKVPEVNEMELSQRSKVDEQKTFLH